MNINMGSMVDSLTNLVLAIGNDENLCCWFETLSRKSMDDRRNEIFAMSERMGLKHKSLNIVAAFKMLAVPKVFEAAYFALKDKCSSSAY